MPNNYNNYNWNQNSNLMGMQSYSNPYQYNNYINRQYQSQPNTQQQQQVYSSSQNNLIWVKGKQNARSMQLPPNSTVILLDSEVGKFYIKTTDDIGLGKLRVFSYIEQPDQDSNNNTVTPDLDLSNYVTKEQLQNKIKEITHNEQSVSAIKQQSTTTTKPTTTINKQF